MPFEPESLAELTRFVQYTMGGIERQLSDLSGKVDKLDVVPRSQYREDMAALKERQREELDDLRSDMTEIKRDFDAFQSKLSSYGRWLVGTVILPIVGLILTVYSILKGIG